jgi:hypothetical protein
MSRVLTSGGILVISDLSAADIAADHERTRRISKFLFEGSPAVADYYQWLDNAGLRVLEAESTLAGRHGLLLCAEKGLGRLPVSPPFVDDPARKP